MCTYARPPPKKIGNGQININIIIYKAFFKLKKIKTIIIDFCCQYSIYKIKTDNQ